MIAFLETWWLVLVLVHVPLIANRLAITLARRLQGTLDRAIPDTLPQTAGDWVRTRAAELGVRAIAVENGTDAFHPRSRIILLSDRTHFKADPTYWAIAAHELGHAHLEVRRPWLAWFLRRLWLVRRLSVRLAVALVVAALLYARAGVIDAAFVLFAVALACEALQLVDEAYASVFAHRELARSAHLEPHHLRAARRVLVVSFSTYAITFASYAALLAQWPLLVGTAGRGWFAAVSPLSTPAWVAAVVITLLGLVIAFYQVSKFTLPASARTRLAQAASVEAVLLLVWHLALAGLVVLVWNLRADAMWEWCVTLALVPLATLARTVAGVPLALPSLLVRRWIGKLDGPGVHDTPEYRSARKAGRQALLYGKHILDSEVRASEHEAPWTWRAFELVPALAYLPLLVALWLV